MPDVLMRRRGLPLFLALFIVLMLATLRAQAHKINVFATAQGKTIEGYVYFSGGGRAKDIAVKVTGPDGQLLGETRTNDAGEFSFDAQLRCDHIFTADSPDGHHAAYTVPADELPDDLPTLGTSISKPGEAYVPPRQPSTASPEEACAPPRQPSTPSPEGAKECSPGRSEASPGYPVPPADQALKGRQNVLVSASPVTGTDGRGAQDEAGNVGPGVLPDQELASLIERAVAKQVAPLREDLQAYEDKTRFRDILGGVGFIAGVAGVILILKHRGSAGR